MVYSIESDMTITLKRLGLRTLRTSLFFALIACSLLMITGKAYSAAGTTVPISAELGTGIAGDLFPVSIKLPAGNLFLTDQVVRFLDEERIGMQVRFQAYDHRPAQGIAISEMADALFSGRLGYDLGTRQILLHDPRIDKLAFDHKNEVTQRLFTELKAIANDRKVYGLLRSYKQVLIRLKTLTYIRLFSGDAISQPSMYAHPDTSLRWRPVRPLSGTGFTQVDSFI